MHENKAPTVECPYVWFCIGPYIRFNTNDLQGWATVPTRSVFRRGRCRVRKTGTHGGVPLRLVLYRGIYPFQYE